jgi:4-nitrophenyl phosphatase
MREPLPGAVDAVRRWLDAGHRLMFVTNNSHATLGAQEEAFAAIGIDASGRLLTSSMAAAHLLQAGSRVVVNGGPGVIEAVQSAGATAVPVESVTDDRAAAEDVTDVVVGFHREFDYQRLHVLSALVRDGARLIGTNSDATYPTNHGVIPGGGAILAAVATAGGVKPVIAGKPHETMAKLVTDRLGSSAVEDMWMVGDRLSTDGLFARRLGCRFVHVHSDVSESGVDVTPDVTVSSFADFVDAALRAPKA